MPDTTKSNGSKSDTGISDTTNSEIEKIVRAEVEELHEFFVRWSAGTAAEDEFEEYLLPRMGRNITFISPKGDVLDHETLTAGLRQGYGSNPDFRIAIRNVKIQQVMEENVLVTYEEWQRNAVRSAQPNNGRISTALIKYTTPVEWIHVQETQLSESVITETSFDF